MSIIKLTLEYDGTDFVGWQFQENGRSVQEEVEKALNKILQTEIRVTGGGRTDAGVHARGQVASFNIEQIIEVNTLARSLNAVLPQDIIVREASEAPPSFNARQSAKCRRYKYYIKPEPTAIQRKYCWQIHYDLNIELMEECSEIIKGKHDFYAFSKTGAEIKNHFCIVNSAGWRRQDGLLVFEISSNRFLHGMVRAIVGTIVDIGRGHNTIKDFYDIINTSDKTNVGMYAPAKGLFLEEISY